MNTEDIRLRKENIRLRALLSKAHDAVLAMHIHNIKIDSYGYKSPEELRKGFERTRILIASFLKDFKDADREHLDTAKADESRA